MQRYRCACAQVVYSVMQHLWNDTQTLIRSQVNERTWNQFFRHLSLCALSKDEAIFEVPDSFFAAWFENHYLSFLSEALYTTIQYRPSIRLVPRNEREIAVPPPTASSNRASATLSSAAPHTSSHSTPARPERQTTSPSPSSISSLQARRPMPPPSPHFPPPPPLIEEPNEPSPEDLQPEHREAVINSRLNPRYSFEQFVVGSSNQFSSAACMAVADRPARAYNPLFLYGGVGLGKTHLLHAIGIEVLRRQPHLRVVYISSEQFMNELIHSLRTRDTNAFRTKYRNECDVLLIDDIQFIAGKDSTQEEFFHTFNALYQSHRQIVLTSDKLPNELPGLEERLRSRFGWGLIADIQPPDIETRIAIIRKKVEMENIPIDDDVSMFLATQIRSNVRELEGSLIRLKAYATLYNRPITLEMAKKQLQAVVLEQPQQVTVKSIQRIVSDYYDVSIQDLVGRRRHRIIAHPRHVAMFLSRQHTSQSFPEIGKHFGKRDHTTVMNAVNKIEKQILTDKKLQAEIRSLEQSIMQAH